MLRDREEKHGEFCQKDVEARKVKGDSKARTEAGLKVLELGVENSLKIVTEVAQSFGEAPYPEVEENLVAVKELCKKMGRKGKAKRTDGGNIKGRRGIK